MLDSNFISYKKTYSYRFLCFYYIQNKKIKKLILYNEDHGERI